MAVRAQLEVLREQAYGVLDYEKGSEMAHSPEQVPETATVSSATGTQRVFVGNMLGVGDLCRTNGAGEKIFLFGIWEIAFPPRSQLQGLVS